MGSKRGKKKDSFYAVFSGRVAEPTIYSSWGDAHPRVTNCEAVFKGFHSIEDARAYMIGKGAQGCKEVIKKPTLETTPTKNQQAYYAVAYGASSGIRSSWHGDGGAFSMTNGVDGACHERFSSKEQAETFIEDWKIAYAEVIGEEVKKALDRGCRPRDMKMDVKGLFMNSSNEELMDKMVKDLKTALVADQRGCLEDDDELVG